MTRKDYEMIAKAIRLATDSGQKHLVHKDQLISELVQRMKEDNQAFDGFRFIEACSAYGLADPETVALEAEENAILQKGWV